MKWINKGYQFEELGRVFRKRNRIYIYGAGEYGKEIYEAIKFMGAVDAFIDRDIDKQKNGYLGVPVLSPDILFEAKEESHLILVAASIKNEKLIMDHLKKTGYVEKLECFHWRDFLDFDYYIPIYWVYSQNKIYLSSGCIIPSTLCNLNCKHCLNFNPYLEKHVIRKLDELYKDIDVFFHWIDYLPRFQISGGEPLLYNNLLEVINYIGENYRSQIVQFEIVTNGTIVPKDDICESFKKYNVVVYLDNYVHAIPDKMNHREEIIEKLNQYNIEVVDNTVDKWFDLDIMNTDNSDKSSSELVEYYDQCNNPWHCYEFGKMYACNFAAFAMKANLNVEESNDFFDMAAMTDANKVELLEFIFNYNEKGYVEFCKKCSGWCSINNKVVPVAEQLDRQ